MSVANHVSKTIDDDRHDANFYARISCHGWIINNLYFKITPFILSQYNVKCYGDELHQKECNLFDRKSCDEHFSVSMKRKIMKQTMNKTRCNRC